MTSSSWLIERRFKELIDRRIRRGIFTSVGELIEAMQIWTAYPKPFVWHETAEQIITKVRRARKTKLHQIKSAADH